MTSNDKATIGVDGFDRSREQGDVLALGAVLLVAKVDLADIVDLHRKPEIPSRRRPNAAACREGFRQRIGELDHLDAVASQRYSEYSRRHVVHFRFDHARPTKAGSGTRHLSNRRLLGDSSLAAEQGLGARNGPPE